MLSFVLLTPRYLLPRSNHNFCLYLADFIRSRWATISQNLQTTLRSDKIDWWCRWLPCILAQPRGRQVKYIIRMAHEIERGYSHIKKSFRKLLSYRLEIKTNGHNSYFCEPSDQSQSQWPSNTSFGQKHKFQFHSNLIKKKSFLQIQNHIWFAISVAGSGQMNVYQI